MLAASTTKGQGYSPDEAVRRMTVADGFEVQLVAAEPLVRQPVAIEFDDRGRLWVVQYLQYPNPAGLTRVKVDRYSRTVYDRVPDPPPRGPQGNDRITILLDTDGDGRADATKDFVTGLNLASGLAFGYGGVFVLNAPYLLFYADRDRDDVPDGDPEVLLTGFGIEDAHSVANSLTWGPDGWLYGTQGSTVTANIRGIEFQQGVWRYHPRTRKFELFCEGGGNSWGLDFDVHGELFYSTNHGGFVMLHGVQGGYYWKNFGKHGALHNPYAFGYFDHVPHADFTGGHVTDGGVIYQGNLFPAEFRGRYIAADLLGHAVYWHTIAPRGSTFSSAHGGTLLAANDTWFAPSDVTIGPDGAVYVADWHDVRTAHPDPDADWDRTNGRIYRILPHGAKLLATRDLRDATEHELIAELASTNEWYARRARLQLAERAATKIDTTVPGRLTAMIFAPQGKGTSEATLPLEALWALYGIGGFTDELVERLLDHWRAEIRAWTVRLVGDEGRVSPEISRRLLDRAVLDPDPIVRRQLASTAKRLPPADGLPIVSALAQHDQDADDPYIPLLFWWALERAALDAQEAVIEQAATPQAWSTKIAREVLLPRLVQRYAAEPVLDCGDALLRIFRSAPSSGQRRRLVAALDEGLRGRTSVPLPQELIELVAADWLADPDDPVLARLAARIGCANAQDLVLARALAADASESTRVAMLDILAEVGQPDLFPKLLPILCNDTRPAIQAATLRALSRGSYAALAEGILAAYSRLTPTARSQARDVLLVKRDWAKLLLDRVDRGEIDAQEVPTEQLRVVASHGDAELDARVKKLWGSVRPPTAEERLAIVRRLNNDVRAAAGRPHEGQVLFRKHCGTCHMLFGEGERIGPDLTHANRRDRDYLLVSIVDPSAVVRKEYVSFNVTTTDGRILTGLIAEQDAANVTLLTAKNERLRLPRSQVDAIEESPNSLMPDNVSAQLSPQELRDLFAWLEQPAPAAVGGK